LSRRYDKSGMEIEAVRTRVATIIGGRFAFLRRIAQATQPSAAIGPERHGPLHGRRRQPGQYGGILRPCVRRGAVVAAFPKSPPSSRRVMRGSTVASTSSTSSAVRRRVG
jgi:hypothetical protein